MNVLTAVNGLFALIYLLKERINLLKYTLVSKPKTKANSTGNKIKFTSKVTSRDKVLCQFPQAKQWWALEVHKKRQIDSFII